MGDESAGSDGGYVWRRDLYLPRRRIPDDDDEPAPSSRRRSGPLPRLVYVTRNNPQNDEASASSSAPATTPDENSNSSAEEENNVAENVLPDEAIEENATRDLEGPTSSSSNVHTLSEPQPPSQPPAQPSSPPPSLLLSQLSSEPLLQIVPDPRPPEILLNIRADSETPGPSRVVSTLSPSQAAQKRRKFFCPPMSMCTPKIKSPKSSANSTEDEDGLVCPICLDMWEATGPHRVVSLKCGHLFGDSCIRRWLKESPDDRVCPKCKAHASPRRIRNIYSRRLRCVDRSEEERLRTDLSKEKERSQTLESEYITLQKSYNQMSERVKSMVFENERMKMALRLGSAGLSYDPSPCYPKSGKTYKLYMERNLEMLRDGGCRVVCYGKRINSLVISQKSPNNLFPSFGVRFVDTSSYIVTSYMSCSKKIVRDVSLSSTDESVIVASREARCRIYETRNRIASATLTGTDMAIWSCAFDASLYEHYVYLGGQNGSTYIIDTRRPNKIVVELDTKGDLSPVIQIISILPTATFSMGGILVCKLQSLWFFEHNETGTPTPSRVTADGPYLSINYDELTENLLLSARPSIRHSNTRYMLGKLEREESGVAFVPSVEFPGTNVSPVLTRSTQINVEENTLVSAYMQDTKLLNLYDARNKKCVQSMALDDVVYDACPVYLDHGTILACITESRCRIYKINT